VPKRSAGLLLYRASRQDSQRDPQRDDRRPDVGPEQGTGAPAAFEVLLVHPGGPYWTRRDDGWWSIPKGEVADGEDALAAAEREFLEELGSPAPRGQRLPLGEVVQAGGKRVLAWAVCGDLDVSTVRSGTFDLEWPPRSGRRRAFPEVDRAAWYGLDTAVVKLLPGQVPLLERLVAAVVPAGSQPPGAAG